SPPVFYTLSLHDALPISRTYPNYRRSVTASFHLRGYVLYRLAIDPYRAHSDAALNMGDLYIQGIDEISFRRCTYLGIQPQYLPRSEEHTSELQSRENLVC